MKGKTKVMWSVVGWAVLCLVLLAVKCEAEELITGKGAGPQLAMRQLVDEAARKTDQALSEYEKKWLEKGYRDLAELRSSWRLDSIFVSIFDKPVDTIRVTCPLCGKCVPTLLWKGDVWTWCCRNTGDKFEKTFRKKDIIVWGKMVRR